MGLLVFLINSLFAFSCAVITLVTFPKIICALCSFFPLISNVEICCPLMPSDQFHILPSSSSSPFPWSSPCSPLSPFSTCSQNPASSECVWCNMLQQSVSPHLKTVWGDFPVGPVVKNPSSKSGGTGSVPGRGTKTLHAKGQLKLCAVNRQAN